MSGKNERADGRTKRGEGEGKPNATRQEGINEQEERGHRLKSKARAIAVGPRDRAGNNSQLARSLDPLSASSLND